MKWLTAIAATSLLFISLSWGDVGAWELAAHEKEKDIKVFTRTVDGTPFKEFKGIIHIKTQVSAFVALFYDVEVATSWMHDVIEFKVIDSPSDTEDVVYTVHKAPWPIADRDVYIHSIMTADASGIVTASFSAVPEYQETNKNYIRMPKATGSWRFTPKEEGIVEVVYQAHANPGGSLPAWLVNAIIVETPMNTLRNLLKIIQEEKYQGKTFAFIEQAKKSQTISGEKNNNCGCKS